MLLGVNWYLLRDVSAQHVSPSSSDVLYRNKGSQLQKQEAQRDVTRTKAEA
jgi:hypothetical protein